MDAVVADRVRTDRLVDIVMPSGSYTPRPAEVEMVASGLGAMEFFLGGEPRQRELFRDCINWDRVFLIRYAGETAGYITYHCPDGVVYNVRFADFIRTYGIGSAWLRYLIYQGFHRVVRSRFCYIERVILKRKFRGKGLGKPFFKACIDYLVGIGHEVIELDAYHKNEPVIHMYQSLGFQILRTMRFPLLKRALPDSVVCRMRFQAVSRHGASHDSHSKARGKLPEESR